MRRKDEWRTIPWPPVLFVLAAASALGAEAWVRSGGSAWLARPLAVVAIALCQNGLQMLHHEGAHGHFFRNPRLNELWTDFWCGAPFFDFVRSYRSFHFAHHRHVGDAQKDPELGFYAEQGYRYEPLKGFRLAGMLLLDACGYHYAQFTLSFARYVWSAEGRRSFGAREALCFLLFWSLLISLGWPVVAYWLGTQATLLFSIAKLRGYAEHAGRPGELNENTFSYPHLPWAVKLAVWPFRGYLHREHHRRPELPWYALRPSESAVRARAPFYQ